MARYYICNRETGTKIEAFATREEAEKELKAYEEDDIKDGIYEENFYEVVEVEE